MPYDKKINEIITNTIIVNNHHSEMEEIIFWHWINNFFKVDHLYLRRIRHVDHIAPHNFFALESIATEMLVKLTKMKRISLNQLK